MKKHSSIVVGLFVVVIFLIFVVRGVAILQAKEYVAEKYENHVCKDKLVVEKVGFIQNRVRNWPVFLKCDGISFQVDILDKNDNFAEKYTLKKYAELILSEYRYGNIHTLDIPFVQVNYGLTDSLKLNNLFYLEVYFDESVNSTQAFAEGVEEILLSLDKSGLSRCDTLEAFAVIDGTAKHIRISPRDITSTTDIINNITTFPVLSEEVSYE